MIRQYKVTPGLMSRILLSIVLLLLFANLFCIFGKIYLGFSFHTMDQFYFNTEGNLPTVFSFLLLLICSVLLWMISEMPDQIQRKKRVYWKLLSAILLFIAVDELISIHETFTDNNAKTFFDGAGRGYLYFAWIIPYVIVFAILFILLSRFFISLPRQTQIRFMIAGFIYVTGAVGFEMIAGNYISAEGEQAKQGLPYMLMVTVEELLEMFAIIIFINSLVKYYIGNVADKSVVVTLNFNDRK